MAQVVGKLGDERHIMVNQENRKTLANFPQNRGQLGAADVINAGSGFIEQQDSGVQKEGTGYRQQAALRPVKAFAAGLGQMVIQGINVRAGGLFQNLPETGPATHLFQFSVR
ncbi:MAG: hypothetical protein NTW61_06800, partial [Candidatus Melainabacteria bacterium]|nr:hypothetical protein [Candidatus Melainabacteria bacterium]